MAKRSVNVRLDGGLLGWADDYAVERGWTRTRVLETALAELRGLASRGVPDPFVAERSERVGRVSSRAPLPPGHAPVAASRPAAAGAPAPRMSEWEKIKAERAALARRSR